jgi:hypothetical protein
LPSEFATRGAAHTFKKIYGNSERRTPRDEHEAREIEPGGEEK